MKWMLSLIMGFLIMLPIHAAPLRIGIDLFDPPFSARASGNQVYGFDVSMMDYVCKKIKQECIFVPIPFKDLIDELLAGRIDVAVGAVAITRDRTQKVQFSIPYMPSQGRFLARAMTNKQPFTTNSLVNQRVATVSGSVFSTDFGLTTISGLKLLTYANIHEVIAALSEGKADFALIDNFPAEWWKMQSGGTLEPVGSPIPYGLGLGIAIAPDNQALKQSIDEAVAEFLKSDTYRERKQMYFGTL